MKLVCFVLALLLLVGSAHCAAAAEKKKKTKSGGPAKVYDAVSRGDITAVRDLLDAGEDINKQGAGGQTPIMHAALTGEHVLLFSLLQ
jgi:ankyrin repeat protein